MIWFVGPAWARPSSRFMWAAFATTICFALSGVCAHRIAKVLGGVRANFFRILLATLLLAAYAHFFGEGWSGGAFGWFFLSGIAGFGLGDVAFYEALPRIGSRLSVLLVHCLAAPFAATVEWLWLGTPLTALKISFALVTLAGVVVALAPSGHLEISRRTFWIGTVCGIIAGVGQGLGVVLSRKGYAVVEMAGHAISPLTASYQRILGGLLIAMAVWYFFSLRGSREKNSPLKGEAWPWLLAGTLAGPVLGVGCYQLALMHHSAGEVLPVVALTPLVIVPLAQWVEGERPTKRSLLGGVIAVAGVVGLAWSASHPAGR